MVSVVMSFTNTGYKMDGVVCINNLDTDTEIVIGMTAPNGAADTSLSLQVGLLKPDHFQHGIIECYKKGSSYTIELFLTQILRLLLGETDTQHSLNSRSLSLLMT